MNNLNAHLAIGATVLAALFTIAPEAVAEERVCRGTIGAVKLDNIRVPDGGSCTLNGTRANGSVVVGTGASLTATAVRINGNVQAQGARSVQVRGDSFVGGSVQIVQGRAATIKRVSIIGDLLFDENNRFLEAIGNRIGGNLLAFENTGGVSIVGNVIDGNLQCKGNAPAPTGGGNQASSKQDQCKKL